MLLTLLTTFLVYFSLAQLAESTSGCVIYDSIKKIITITCKHANFTDIYHVVNDPTVLHREAAPDDSNVWVLNANIEVANDAILYVNSTDTSWLKILTDGKNAYLIHIKGSLKIDSVKITSWNQYTNDY